MKNPKISSNESVVDVQDISVDETEAVVGGLSFSKISLNQAVIAKSTLKVDPRLGDFILNGACGCCSWEPAIV